MCVYLSVCLPACHMCAAAQRRELNPLGLEPQATVRHLRHGNQTWSSSRIVNALTTEASFQLLQDVLNLKKKVVRCGIIRLQLWGGCLREQSALYTETATRNKGMEGGREVRSKGRREALGQGVGERRGGGRVGGNSCFCILRV